MVMASKRNNAGEVITDIILGVPTNRVGQWEDPDRGYPGPSPHFHYKAALCARTSHLTQFPFDKKLWNRIKNVRIYKGYEIGTDHNMLKAKIQVQKENTPKDMERTSNEKIRSYKLKNPKARATYQEELEKLMDKALTEGNLNWEKTKKQLKKEQRKYVERPKLKEMELKERNGGTTKSGK
ncbi:hypothetical protein ILUMI_01792 [Ignelater luminosus]|uniref:Uncharacterized protein n=1 Tax=Ignelater luminosus TaxID=2038154 RepID=A0A8K0DJJ6_IGNLU|nr:hypothetical protein ILUMI_01792 [Ignelater luminosus]